MGSRGTRALAFGLGLAIVAGPAGAVEPGDGDAYEDPEERQEILGALRALSARLDDLEGSEELTAAHQTVRRSLGDDVASAIDEVVTGRYAGARFLIGQMTESCFACHTQQPTEHSFDLGTSLLESPAIAEAPLPKRALVAVAARQFDTSLALHEELFVDRSYSAMEIALSGALEQYLKIAIRVRDEPARAITGLRAFRQRSDLPRYLASEIGVWIGTLENESRVVGETGLVRAREWIRRGRSRTAYPGDQQGLAHFVLASRDLHRHLRTEPEDRLELAETFYWLGLAEIHIGLSFWVSEAEDFLEKSIRTAPEADLAPQAYAALEALYVTGFTGSSGTHLPVEIERKLESLRLLIDETRTPASAEDGGTT
ncbi:MAG: hypothetical protein HKP30_17045 [Myxococcales bacterium]|nr:hypothetical protein [Myxococcales bacterium]